MDIGPNVEIVRAERWPGPSWANHGFLIRNPVDGREKWTWQFDHPDGKGATSYSVETDPWPNTHTMILVKEIKFDGSPK